MNESCVQLQHNKKKLINEVVICQQHNGERGFAFRQSYLDRGGLWHLSENDDAAAVVRPNFLTTFINLHHGRGCNKKKKKC